VERIRGKREIIARINSGTVRDEDGNILIYSAAAVFDISQVSK